MFIYARPRRVKPTDLCHFYASTTLPVYGEAVGQWDLRGRVDEYLGNVDLRGKRVLEIGPASGFLTFEMEARGANVVGVEIPPGQSFDVIPFATMDVSGTKRGQAVMAQYMRNAFWRAHAELDSKAKIYYGDVLDLPDAMGQFDVALMASVLQHLHDPVGVVMSCAARTTDTIIVTDLDATAYTGVKIDEPVLELHPGPDRPSPFTWWLLRPKFFEVLLPVLGFTEVTTTFHEQHFVYDDTEIAYFTTVASKPR